MVDYSHSTGKQVEVRDLAVVRVVMVVPVLAQPGRSWTGGDWKQLVKMAVGMLGTYSDQDLALERVRATWETIRVVRTEIGQTPVY